EVEHGQADEVGAIDGEGGEAEDDPARVLERAQGQEEDTAQADGEQEDEADGFPALEEGLPEGGREAVARLDLVRAKAQGALRAGDLARLAHVPVALRVAHLLDQGEG